MIHLYTSPSLYANLVNTCTGLWLISNDDQLLSKSLEKIFVETSLSDDVYRLPILMDIWTLYLRYDVDYISSSIDRARITFVFLFIAFSYTTNENRLLYCQQWLRWHQHLSPIAQSPSNVFIQKILKYTLNLLSDEQRSQIVRDVASENASHIALLLPLELAANGDVAKFKQFGQQIVNRIKESFNKLNPRADLVTTDEYTELVNEHCLNEAVVSI